MKRLQMMEAGMVMAFAMTILAAGCGSNSDDMLTAEEFKTLMEDQGLEVVDQTSSASDNTYLQIYVALDEDKYSLEYYFMKNDNSAVDVFDYAVLNLDNIYAEDSSAEIDSRNNSYSVDASNYYVTVTRKDNTVLYVTAYPDYADEAQELMKSIGF